MYIDTVTFLRLRLTQSYRRWRGWRQGVYAFGMEAEHFQLFSSFSGVKRAFSGRTIHTDTSAMTPLSTDTLKADRNTHLSCN